jgi:hypothetical protein
LFAALRAGVIANFNSMQLQPETPTIKMIVPVTKGAATLGSWGRNWMPSIPDL